MYVVSARRACPSNPTIILSGNSHKFFVPRNHSVQSTTARSQSLGSYRARSYPGRTRARALFNPTLPIRRRRTKPCVFVFFRVFPCRGLAPAPAPALPCPAPPEKTVWTDFVRSLKRHQVRTCRRPLPLWSWNMPSIFQHPRASMEIRKRKKHHSLPYQRLAPTGRGTRQAGMSRSPNGSSWVLVSPYRCVALPVYLTYLVTFSLPRKKVTAYTQMV